MPKGVYKHKPKTEECKIKIKLKLKGRHISPLTEFKKGENTGKLGDRYGKEKSKEIRNKINKTRRKNNSYRKIGEFKHSEKTKRKIKENAKINPNFGMKGKNHSKETKNKLRLANIGKHLSKETKKKMSLVLRKYSGKNNPNFSMKGRKHTKKTIQKLSGKNHHNYGKPIPDEVKRKMSESRLKRFKEKGFREQHLKNIFKRTTKFPTSFEKKIARLCIENSLPFVYTGDGKFWINFKNPDFVNYQEKVVIEVFYSWFKIRDYGSVENYRKHCIKKYNPAGWKVIFIDENEVNVNNWKELCLSKLNNFKEVC